MDGRDPTDRGNRTEPSEENEDDEHATSAAPRRVRDLVEYSMQGTEQGVDGPEPPGRRGHVGGLGRCCRLGRHCHRLVRLRRLVRFGLVRLGRLLGLRHRLTAVSAASICPGLMPPVFTELRTPEASMKKWAGIPLTRYADAMRVSGSAIIGYVSPMRSP